MAVKKKDVAIKAATPAVVLIGGANLLQWITGITGHPMDGETAYTVVSSLYAVAIGLSAFFAKR